MGSLQQQPRQRPSHCHQSEVKSSPIVAPPRRFNLRLAAFSASLQLNSGRPGRGDSGARVACGGAVKVRTQSINQLKSPLVTASADLPEQLRRVDPAVTVRSPVSGYAPTATSAIKRPDQAALVRLATCIQRRGDGWW